MLDSLGDRIAEGAALLDSALHRLLTDIRQFDEQAGWHRQGATSCAHWLNWRVGIDLGAAREKVRVARALGTMPRLDAALARGELSYSKARAISRVATPETEAMLVEMARTTTASQLESICRRFRQIQTPPGVPDDRRQLRVRETQDGMVRLEVTLTAEEAALVVKACDASASASAETHGRVDGLVAMAERTLRNPLPESESPKGHPPVELLVHIDASTLSGQLDNGVGLSAETSRRLLCDAGVVPVVEDGEGNVLNVGRKTRTIPAALRRALWVRDSGCRFPGCTHTLTDAHHIRHWADGGETSLQNTLELCRHHHGQVHEGGFRLERREDGTLRFLDPDGDEVLSTGKRPPLADPGWETLRNRLSDEGFVPDAHTAYPSWDGDPVDFDAVLDALTY